MRVLVIGAGVIGLTSAYYLRADGHEVTVVDACDKVGTQASYANGGQLSYSYVAPLAGPGVLSNLPRWLLSPGSPVKFRPAMDPAQWRWCLGFISACTQGRSEATTRILIDLSFRSRALMNQFLHDEPDADFDFDRSGKLVLHRDRASFEDARRLLAYQRTLGCEQYDLSADECLKLEPSLANLQPGLVGGIFTPSEESGDCHRFCIALEKCLRESGTRFRLGTTITRLAVGRCKRVIAYAGSEALHTDQVVLAAGLSSVELARQLDLRLSLYPLKGYSLTVPVRSPADAPAISVTDFKRKIVYARLGERLRVAGMADLVGRTATIDALRIAVLKRQAAEAFPNAGDFDKAHIWAGLRPATPTGIPMIGATEYPNLWLNVGHGALGFTLALGSARRLSDQMTRTIEQSQIGSSSSSRAVSGRGTRDLAQTS